MKILVTGANGFIAQHIIGRLLLKQEHLVIGAGKGMARFSYPATSNFRFYSLDITKRDEVERCARIIKPTVVIHAAALSQPDYCELHKDECTKVNLLGTENVIEACRSISAYVLFVSTDFVFNGQNGPYKEDDHVDPLNQYGFSKAQAEELCVTSGLPFSIVRLCSVYGRSVSGQNRNIVMWVKQNLENNTAIKVVNDQVRTPTYVDDVVYGIIKIAEQKLPGIYHIAGEETLTPYNMAIQTAGYFGLDESLIEKVSSATFIEPAKRPLVTGLITARAKKDVNLAPIPFIAALDKMFTDHRGVARQ